MAAHGTAQKGTATQTFASEEARLREQVKKLNTHLDSAEREFQQKEEALKQTVGLLMTLSRPAVQPALQDLLDRLGGEIKKDFQPRVVRAFVADLKTRISQEAQPTASPAAKEPSPTITPKAQAPVREPAAVVELQSRRSAASSPESQTSVAPLPKPSPLPVAPAASSSQAPTGVQEHEVEEKIRVVLNALLVEVHLKDQHGLQEKINVVKAALREGGLFRRLPQVQQQLTEVLAYYRQLQDTERTRLEDILKELIDKLAEIEKSLLSELLENHRETMAGNEQFAQQLEGQVANMEEAAHLKDLDAVRTAVSTRTARMRAAIQVKRDADAALSEAFSSRVHTLERQLRDANHQLSSMTDRAYHDPLLVGVYNRLAFNERLNQEVVRFQRYQHPASLLIFDMDRFKQVNDVYGHQAGDWALQTLAARVKPALRAPDFFARFGGDEFAVILPETSLDGAVVVGKRLRTLVEGTTFSYEGHILQVTLSLGAATIRPDDTAESILERADQSLYLAKEQGRNRVCAETDLPPPPPPSALDKMKGFFSRKLPFGK
jgi:diguanylate cyclase